MHPVIVRTRTMQLQILLVNVGTATVYAVLPLAVAKHRLSVSVP